MDSLYFQPYSYRTSDSAGNIFVWPATLAPSGPSIGPRRVTLQQAPVSEVGWASGDKKLTLVPIVLVGEIKFDTEQEANIYVAKALAHIGSAVKLRRMEKEGDLLDGCSFLIPYFNGRNATTVEFSLTLMPKNFPKINGREVVW